MDTTQQPAALPADELRELYRLVTAVRQLDLAAIAWQRQGIIPGYAPELGQEAAQVGSAFAMDPQRDFIFPTYREMGVALTLGVDMTAYMSTHKASWHGGLYDPVKTRLAPIQAVVGGSVLHAVGWAHGQTLSGGDTRGVALTYFGDGASSQGDVHEAMNFAGVLKAPVIFFVQNNGWAISLPTEAQVAGGTVAARAAGYGMRAITVDGNDAAAVVLATREAAAHARAGHGPVLIEAMTYRRGPHSTSDDPGRYRSLEEERRDAGTDPVQLLADRLLAEGIADSDFLDTALADAKANAERVREGVEALGVRPGREMFDFVYAEPTEALKAQARAWREESEHV
ncbi:pyruvate dehydrogenase [Arthrobacter sp. zg-Y20]|uniref:thiamine pyrophosphate-dependent enzyme n=1 Tax=unclassified Arthrobacter TaxID=235627 RepID=UPI001D13D8FD|nr:MULTISPECIES: thiamine pyrophosphate-dependent enzyme [unclassified Arthrobacter]MCC3277464.1 pyruvate dehydrogenase [Arthrobacter sp. zg-Y20]MDK1317625.1 thiamine pyrophosphate-dependent enzyme [Arthrobacter sp. zg.Y20]MDK1329167.1 thiamine pyrophosphate-dependent enzyme [Arthrobacter sp. zg-Y1143]WIB05152.1 thiamine pyrophosphate-dependent enzyme [Arthrobacter sp. zg-Y20]